MQRYVAIWALWMECEGVLSVRYEDLVNNYDFEMNRLVDFLGYESAEGSVQEVLNKYRPEQGDRGQKGTHFSKGQAERYRSIFTAEQLADLNQAFQPAIERMGYAH
jgi:hypothetical protein